MSQIPDTNSTSDSASIVPIKPTGPKVNGMATENTEAIAEPSAGVNEKLQFLQP